MLFLLLLLGACRGPTLADTQPVTVRVVGATSFTSDLADLAAAYQADHPQVLIDVQGTDTAAGLRSLDNKEADLAAVSWQPAGTPLPSGLQAIPVARDGVAMIVHPGNPITGLTLLQVKALFEGEVLEWGTVGGRDEPPLVVSREDGSGTRDAFEAMVMGSERVTLDAVVMPSSQAVVSFVAGHANAIGYVTMGEINDRVKALRVEDESPSPANVRAGAYPLTRLLYLYWPDPPLPAAQGFVDFVTSPAGQAIVARRHVPLR